MASVFCSKCSCQKSPEEMSAGRSYCKECRAEQMKAWRQRNAEHVKTYKLKYKEEHPDARKIEYANNPEKEKQRAKKYYAKNAQKRKEAVRLYKLSNRPVYNASEAKRRASKLNATPAWLTEDDDFIFNEIYEMAKVRSEDTGVEHHVDHIVPLQGIEANGLHVWWNLQIIPASENLSKSNKL